MHATVRLGRIAGVEIGINWTWLFVVALIGWSLADSVFPSTNPGLATGTYVAMAAVAVPLFFACLLAHELGHATRARREGMEIKGITLWLFGGVAQFRGRFPSAGAEFRVAVAGPLVSLALGVVLLGVAILAPLPPAVDGTLYWLGSTNLLLLVFNMLPALPLDGGRVLHSALWAREHDYAAATHKAAALGRGFGRLMIVGGVALVIFVGDLGGLWLALIGWFLLGAAEAEEQYVERHRTLGGLTVADVMARDPATAPADLPLDRFMEDVFFPHRHTAYPVVDGGRAIGLISFRAVAVVPRMHWSHLRVRDQMLPLAKVAVFAPVDELDSAIGRLLAAPLSRGLALDHGRLAGLLSGTDAMRVLEARTGHSLPRAA